MRRLALITTLPLLFGSVVQAQEAMELRWTKVATPDLDGFQATAGNVRINNVIIGRRDGAEAAGPATEHEFSASIANRTDERLRVVLQLVGVTADGTPTLSAESYVDVDAHRNEQMRQSFRAGLGALGETQAIWVRATSAAP